MQELGVGEEQRSRGADRHGVRIRRVCDLAKRISRGRARHGSTGVRPCLAESVEHAVDAFRARRAGSAAGGALFAGTRPRAGIPAFARVAYLTLLTPGSQPAYKVRAEDQGRDGHGRSGRPPSRDSGPTASVLRQGAPPRTPPRHRRPPPRWQRQRGRRVCYSESQTRRRWDEVKDFVLVPLGLPRHDDALAGFWVALHAGCCTSPSLLLLKTDSRFASATS